MALMISMKKFEEGTPIVIAHRGGAELFTENTLTAFRKAEELGVDAIECDIHLTKDHHIVVLHDPDLKRVAGIDRKISEMTLEEVKRVNLNGGETIPTLEDTIQAVSVQIVVELKSFGALMELGKLFHHNPELIGRCTVICFDHRAIQKLKKAIPTLSTGALLAGFPVDPVTMARSCGADTISLYYEGLDRDFVKMCHSGGLKVSVWTPNAREELQKMIDIGVDAIATDRPDILLDLLNRK